MSSPFTSSGVSSQVAAHSQPVMPSSMVGSSENTGLNRHVVEAEFHNTQGSYIIPRRYPRQLALSYSESVQRLLPTKSCGAVQPAMDSAVIAGASQPQPASYEESLLAMEQRLLGKCKDMIESSITSLFSKLGKFLIEIFSVNLFKENCRERELLLIGLLRNHFGPQIGDPLLEQYHRSSGQSLSSKDSATQESASHDSAPSTQPRKGSSKPTGSSRKPMKSADKSNKQASSRPSTRSTVSAVSSKK